LFFISRGGAVVHERIARVDRLRINSLPMSDTIPATFALMLLIDAF
jgi:hypothetical protein